MYQSPNSNKRLIKNQRYNSYSLGDNNLSARFSNALSIILSREYYEGSRYGKVYKQNRPDGKSQIYIDQPELEKKISKQFINVNDDIVKFLVGPTGIGKTTLIRNIFQVFGRDVTVTDNNLIIYVSFYSMVSYFDKTKDPHMVVQDAILAAINGAVSFLNDKDYLDRMESYDDAYYDDFYSFVVTNNNYLIQTVPDDSANVEKIQKGNGRKYILDWLQINKPVDYRMCQLKYYLHLYKKENKMFDNIILILDDIESLESKYTDNILDYAYHCKKCLQANINRGYNFKVLISMRNYSYRIQQIRRKEAFREIPWDDVILKDTAPELSRIIERRIDYVLKSDEVLKSVDDKNAYEVAKDNLGMILKRMYGQYDKMLLSLTHNNIFTSMTLLFRILTNKAHFGKHEINRASQKGAFVISEKDYYVDNNSNNSEIPGNDDVYYALVYGEQNVYFDDEDYYLANIMHYKNKENKSTELLGIYIIQYFTQQGIDMNNSSYDGFETILSTKAIEDIISLYSFATNKKSRSIRDGLEFMMEHLYKGGVLLQSIVEPVIEEVDGAHKVYSSEMKFFLSLRGSQLYRMLSYNALLITTYRDDIDTDMAKNNIPSLDMSMSERMIYCLNYINYLSDKEIEIFRNVVDYEIYRNMLGSELAVVVLMKGMKQTIKVYYNIETQTKMEIIHQYKSIQKKVNDFLDSIYEESLILFTHIEPI